MRQKQNGLGDSMIERLQDGPLDLDELDRMLIRELEHDARVSYSTLASKLDASRPTIRRRLNSLVDRGIVTIAAMPDYRALGYRTVLTLAITAPPGMVNKIAEQLSSVTEIKYVWITAGRYDLMSVAFYRSPEEYMELFPEAISEIPENVRMESLLSIKLIRANPSHQTKKIPAVDSQWDIRLTELDRAVIRGLEISPRILSKDLAQDIGASLPSVRASLRKLSSEGVLRVIGAHGPAVFGRKIIVTSLVQVNPSRITTLIDKLKVHPCVTHITITFGGFNCLVYSSFDNSQQMSDYLAHDLGSIPGVSHSESLISLKTVKRQFAFVSQDQGRHITQAGLT